MLRTMECSWYRETNLCLVPSGKLENTSLKALKKEKKDKNEIKIILIITCLISLWQIIPALN